MNDQQEQNQQEPEAVQLPPDVVSRRIMPNDRPAKTFDGPGREKRG
jgi:hypothetical protein